MKLTLYPWQEECLDSWFHNGSRGIVNVVTGAGKTIMALAAMKKLDTSLPGDLRVKIVVPKTFMLSQWASAMLNFSESLGISRSEIGYYYGTYKDSVDRKYMIYVINSARYTLARHIIDDISLGYSVLVIADECHHYGSTENKKIFDFIPVITDNAGCYFSLGLSATPQTADYNSVLVPALGKEIYKYGFSDAMRMNTISNFAVFHIALSFIEDELVEYESLSDRLTLSIKRMCGAFPYLKKLDRSQFFRRLEYLSKKADNPVHAALARSILRLSIERSALVYSACSRIDCVCKLVQSLDNKSKIIIFGERIEQSNLLFDRLNLLYPNQVGRYHSKLAASVKKNVLNRYSDGELRILVSCRALDEGLDIPSANVGIILSSTSIERQRIQRLGRVLRHSEGKRLSCLYYLYVKDSTEAPVFFEKDVEGSQTFCLQYCAESNSFLHPEYDELAESVLANMKLKTEDTKLLLEAFKCLGDGAVRTDWLMDAAECHTKMQAASTTKERNYWICMLQMINLRLCERG